MTKTKGQISIILHVAKEWKSKEIISRLKVCQANKWTMTKALHPKAMNHRRHSKSRHIVRFNDTTSMWKI